MTGERFARAAGRFFLFEWCLSGTITRPEGCLLIPRDDYSSLGICRTTGFPSASSSGVMPLPFPFCTIR